MANTALYMQFQDRMQDTENQKMLTAAKNVVERQKWEIPKAVQKLVGIKSP